MKHSLRSLPSLMALLMLSACAAPTPNVPASTEGQPSASPSTAPQASSEPSTAPGAATPTPGAVETTTIRGKVYDATGAAVPDGTRVTVKSLDPATPFDTTVTTAAGTYVVNAVPVSRQVEIAATRDGWTRRTRVEVPRLNEAFSEKRNVFNFGGRKDDADPAGPAYFLSGYPEIESVEPLDGARSRPSDRMTFKLTMSEPLDRQNQRRLAAAFTLIPNSQAALPDGAALPDQPASAADDLKNLRSGSKPATTAGYRYRQNSTFLDGAILAEFKWEADGKTATFSLDAPVKTDKLDEGEYAFILIQADDDPIKDKDGNALGMRDANAFGSTVKGDIIRFAVREPELSLAPNFDTDKARWADTHRSYTWFSVAKDTTAPKVVSVRARRNVTATEGSHDRIEVTFSEAMVAYPNITGSELLSLNNYVFAVADNQEDLDAKTIKPDGKAADIAGGASLDEIRAALESGSGASFATNRDSMPGIGHDVAIALSTRDPKTVIVKLPPGSLPLKADFIKVFAGPDTNAVEGSGKALTDPAGNPVEESGNQITGPID